MHLNSAVVLRASHVHWSKLIDSITESELKEFMMEAGDLSARAHANAYTDSRYPRLVLYEQLLMNRRRARGIQKLVIEASVQVHSANRFSVVVEARRIVNASSVGCEIARSQLIYRLD